MPDSLAMLSARVAGLSLLLLAASECGGITPETQQALDRMNEKFQHDLEQIRAELNNGLSLALCTQDVQQMLQQIRQECKDGQLCTTNQIKSSVVEADPEHKERFLRLMLQFRHEVVYIDKGQKEVIPARKKHLDSFAGLPRFQNTRYLIVSSPEKGVAEAERRADLVKQYLIERNVPESTIDPPWLYMFKVNRLEIQSARTNDLPMFGEPRSELSVGVWIFRVDC